VKLTDEDLETIIKDVQAQIQAMFPGAKLPPLDPDQMAEHIRRGLGEALVGSTAVDVDDRRRSK